MMLAFLIDIEFLYGNHDDCLNAMVFLSRINVYMTQNTRLYHFTPKPYEVVVENLVSNPKDQGALIRIIRHQGFGVNLEWLQVTFESLNPLNLFDIERPLDATYNHLLMLMKNFHGERAWDNIFVETFYNSLYPLTRRVLASIIENIGKLKFVLQEGKVLVLVRFLPSFYISL